MSWLILLEGDPVSFVDWRRSRGRGVDPDELELGVVVHPRHWGSGIAAEAGLAVVRDVFERVGRERVYAGVDPTNDRSLRALAKAPESGRKVNDELTSA